MKKRKQRQADKKEINITTTHNPQERFFPDEEQGHKLLRIGSINIGAGGIVSHLHRLIEWADEQHLAIIHIQEARLRKWNAASLRKNFKKLTDDYRLYIHCSDGSRDTPTTSVATIIRKEVAQYTTSLAPTITQGSPLTGRVLAFRIKTPETDYPFVTVNCWMPHQGAAPADRREAFKQLTQRIEQWRKGPEETLLPMVLHGDFNATLEQEGSTHLNTILLQQIIQSARLRSNASDTHPSWASHADPTQTARIDHCLHTEDLQWAQDTQLSDTLISTSDHIPLISVIHEIHGVWAYARRTPRTQRTTIDLEKFHEKVPIWEQKVYEQIRTKGNPADLQKAEQEMMEAIKEVGALKTIILGGKKKPKKDPTTEELRHHAAIARKCSHLSLIHI